MGKSLANNGLLEDIPCPLCAQHAPIPWARESGYDAVKCGNCGLVYVSPRPNAAAVSEAVQLGQHATETGVLDVKFKRSKRRVRDLRLVVEAMYADTIATGKAVTWLDVGAGYGEFIEALEGALPAGSDVSGIEPMRHKAEIAQSYGVSVRSAPLASVEAATYDVVSLMNVFSHVPDFRTFLGELRTKIKPGGELFLQTGNGGDLSRRSAYPDTLYLPDHLVFAGEQHIEGFFGQAGFRLIGKTARRFDTPMRAVKAVAKRLLGRPSYLVVPYASDFRTVFYRARAV